MGRVTKRFRNRLEKKVVQYPPGDVAGRIELSDEPVYTVLKLLGAHVSGFERHVPVIVVFPAIIDDALLSDHLIEEPGSGQRCKCRHLDRVNGYVAFSPEQVPWDSPEGFQFDG
jgi:hypothetical protein